jgi:hypothetical protein
MPCVLDAAIVACWAFDDEDRCVGALRVRVDQARVPSLRRFEVRNTLIVSERRGYRTSTLEGRQRSSNGERTTKRAGKCQARLTARGGSGMLGGASCLWSK